MLRTWTYAWWRPVARHRASALVGVLRRRRRSSSSSVAGVGVLRSRAARWVDNFMASADTRRTSARRGCSASTSALGSMILVTWFVIRVVHRHAAAVAGLRRTRHAVAVPRGLPRARRRRPRRPGARRDCCCPATPGTSSAASSTTSRRRPRSAPWSCCSPRRCRPRARSTSSAATCCRRSGRCSGNRWVAIVLTATLFALAHGAQNFPLFFDRFAFGLIAGWLVIRTGGLEAGIALHVLNNFLAFGFALSFGDLSDDAERHGGQLVEHPRSPSPSPVSTPGWCSCGPPDGPADPHPPPGTRRPDRPVASVRRRLREPRDRRDWRRIGRVLVRERTCILVRASQGAEPMGYGVIGSPTGSGPVSLGSSPSTPAITSQLATLIGLRSPAFARVSSALAPVV